MFIYPRDAADLKLCLPLPSFSLTKAGIRIIRERQTIPLQTSAIKNAALDSCMCIGFLPNACRHQERTALIDNCGADVSVGGTTSLRAMKSQAIAGGKN